MNETTANYAGRWAIYNGSNFNWSGREFKIIRQDGQRLMFDPENGNGPVWRHVNAFSDPYDKVDTSVAVEEINTLIDNMFAPKTTEQALLAIRSERTRLQERIAELDIAEKVLNNL